MLVLTRKRSEMIQIGEGIVIKIIHTGRSTVKIGIDAPKDVRVMRAELSPVAGEKLVEGQQEQEVEVEMEMVSQPSLQAVGTSNRLKSLMQERRTKRVERDNAPIPAFVYGAHAACDCDVDCTTTA